MIHNETKMTKNNSVDIHSSFISKFIIFMS